MSMPTINQCVFSIPDATDGTRLTGGFVPIGPPSPSNVRILGGEPAPAASRLEATAVRVVPLLRRGDALRIVLKWKNAGQPPSSLVGMCTFSPAVEGQARSTPFRDDRTGRHICFWTGDAHREDLPDEMGVVCPTFQFHTFWYQGVDQGRYELTFVAEDPATGRQWSEDPEFDTEG